MDLEQFMKYPVKKIIIRDVMTNMYFAGLIEGIELYFDKFQTALQFHSEEEATRRIEEDAEIFSKPQYRPMALELVEVLCFESEN